MTAVKIAVLVLIVVVGLGVFLAGSVLTPIFLLAALLGW